MPTEMIRCDVRTKTKFSLTFCSFDFNMSKHLDQIKEMMLFDEPDFDEDEDEGEEEDEDEEEEKPTAKKNVETIVFRDPAKRRKAAKVEPPKATTDKTETEFDLEKARFDVYKFGIKGFDKQKYENARVSLAVSLGAKVSDQRLSLSLSLCKIVFSLQNASSSITAN